MIMSAKKRKPINPTKESDIPSWLWIKKYFDTGLGLTAYAKYLIAIFGIYTALTDLNPIYLVILGVFYLFLCILLGWLWIKYNFFDKELEINNRLNPFQKEVRTWIKKR